MRDIRLEFLHNFNGMTAEPVGLDTLLATRHRMVQELQSGLDVDERKFLLSLVAGSPDWAALNVAHAENLPALRWKLHNLEQLARKSPRKFFEQRQALAQRL